MNEKDLIEYICKKAIAVEKQKQGSNGNERKDILLKDIMEKVEVYYENSKN